MERNLGKDVGRSLFVQLVTGWVRIMPCLLLVVPHPHPLRLGNPRETLRLSS